MTQQTTEARTEFGYPVFPPNLLEAQAYAANVRARKDADPCQCKLCAKKEELERVQRICAGYGRKK